MSFSTLPTELILNIAQFLTWSDHARLIRVSKRHEQSLSRALYAGLAPAFTVGQNQQKPSKGKWKRPRKRTGEHKLTRNDIVIWACENGSVSTLCKINETEALCPLINLMPCGIGRGIVSNRGHRTRLLKPLHLAALFGHSEITRFLLEKGAKVNDYLLYGSLANGVLPIHFASTADVIKTLISYGSHFDQSDQGYSPLIVSLSYRADASACRAFLDLGANPNYVDPSGRTAAMAAIQQGNIECLRILLEAGVDTNKAFRQDEHLLCYAIWSAGKFPESEIPDQAVRLLLDYGTDANSGYQAKIGPLGFQRQMYVSYIVIAAMLPDTADIFELLLERGADISQLGRMEGALIKPISSHLGGSIQIKEGSLAANLVASIIYAPPPFVNKLVFSPDVARKLELLVKHGASIDSPFSHGQTPLQLCLNPQDGREALKAIEVIPLLVTLGAVLSSTDTMGHQPLHLLMRQFCCRVHCQRPYLPYFSSYRPARLSLIAKLMNLFIDHGADPNAVDKNGRTPLMHLCRQEHRIAVSPLIRALLQRPGVDPNTADNWGCTALHYTVIERGAAYSEEARLRLQMLLNHNRNGIETNRRDHLGLTPLHLLLKAQDPIVSRLNSPEPQRDRWRRAQVKRRVLTMLIRAGADTTARVSPLAQEKRLHSGYDQEGGSMGVESEGSPTSNNFELTPLHLASQSRELSSLIKSCFKMEQI